MTVAAHPPEALTVTVPGARLSGELTRHRGERRGMVVVRTPYDAVAHRPLAASLAARGWDCFVQDVRGRYASTGTWQPYAGEADDGGATLEALRTAGLSGPLVLLGASYAAHTALETVAALGGGGVAAVVAMVPALGLHETAYDVAGTPQHRHRLGWWHLHGFTQVEQPLLATDVLDTAAGIAALLGPIAAAKWLGWDGARLAEWTRLWSADPIDVPGRYGDLAVPLLVVTGDLDPFDGHARRLAADWGCRRGTDATLLSGPWGHDLVPRCADGDRVMKAAGGPGGRILDWLAGLGPAPGIERRLDPARRQWLDHPHEGAA